MRLLWVMMAVASLAFAGCVTPANQIAPAATDGAEDLGKATFGKPLPDTITGLTEVASTDVPTGAGIWTFGNYVYVSARNEGFHVVDVSDPANPVTVGSVPGSDVYARDVDVLTYDDGRVVAVLAGQGQGMHFVDVTDPANPVILSTVETADLGGSGVHNVAVVPGTHYVFNSGSGGNGDDIDVVNAEDPANPEILGSWGTHGCHDITFFMSEDKQRAYCAGIEETQIWDISNLTDGQLIASVTNPFVSATGATVGQQGGLAPGLHHLAIVNEDASLLIVGDEYTGGIGPGCGAHVPGGPDTPLGAIWFYDITDEANPKHLGHFSPDAPVMEHANGTLSCTAHFGELVPGHDMIAISWYAAGVMLVDFSDPAEPTLVDQWNPGADTWDVRYANGYLFTGDINRGMDILTFE